MRWLPLSTFVLLLSAPAFGDDGSEQEARELYLQGKAQFARERYADAIAAFERSYALSQAPALLFNLAQAHRLSGPSHCARALSLYRSYLDAAPRAENEREVHERIGQMAQCVRDQEAAASSPAPPVSPQPPAPRVSQPLPSRVGPVLTTGVGAALVVAGAVLYGSARHKFSEAEQECPCYPGRYAGWETATYIAYGLLATGSLTLAGGVTWWVSLDSPARPGAADQALLGVAGHF